MKINRKKKSMGLDLGSKTCGVAISDGLNMFAHPYTTLYFDGVLEDLIKPLEEIIESEGIIHIVLGYPKMMNNDIGERALLSESFKSMIEEQLQITVDLMDERLTTKMSTSQLINQDVSRKERKKIIDQVAAVNILQTYLDRARFMEG